MCTGLHTAFLDSGTRVFIAQFVKVLDLQMVSNACLDATSMDVIAACLGHSVFLAFNPLLEQY